MQLRPFQSTFCRKVIAAFRTYQRVLGILPTGGGKTICFSDIARQARGRVLIVAHREELLTQAINKLERLTGIKADLERSDSHASLEAKVVVASVQTICGRFEKRFPANHFSIVIVDECHHVMAKSYQGFLQYFMSGGAKVLGVTATAGTKGAKSLGNFFEVIADQVTLPDLIHQGYLSRVRVKAFPLRANMETAAMELGQKLIQKGDYSENVAAHALEPFLDDIAQRLPFVVGARKTLIFVPLVRTAHLARLALERAGASASVVHGGSEDRHEITGAHGVDYQYLVNSMLLTEGYDDPEIESVLILRPTRSEILFSQMVGRGTRIFCPWGCHEHDDRWQACRHAGRKKDLLLLDPLWLHEDMKLCRPSMLVTSNEEDRCAMDKRSSDSDEEFDLEDARKEAEHERETALAKKLARAQRRRPTAITLDEWNAMEDRPPHEWTGGRPATEKQLALLIRLGFDPKTVPTMQAAGAIIGDFFERKKKGLCLPKTLRQLKAAGYPNAQDATEQEGKAFLQARWNQSPKPIPATA